MNSNINITVEIQKYLQFCTQRKNLDHKTTKSYSIDLRQFTEFIYNNNLLWVSKSSIEKYIDSLHNTFKPKSVKRKIATIKAFFHYLEIEEIIDINPFHKIQIKYKEPFILPKTIPIHNITKLINYAYRQYTKSTTEYGEKTSLRNVIILELLFATGMRISELCSLRLYNIDLSNYIIKIYGKGSKERLIQLCNKDVQKLLRKYCNKFNDDNSYLFINRLGNRLSEQSVRNMITKYAEQCGITQHITPHMFRHSFATLLLEEDVDIRYIQQMLGHSSITTTQIYTHTSISKQKEILISKHPRNKMVLTI